MKEILLNKYYIYSFKNDLKEAFYNRSYIQFIKKYSDNTLFIAINEISLSAIDELLSLALLRQCSARRNCRVKKLIDLINENNYYEICKLFVSVAREANLFEKCAFMTLGSNLLKDSDLTLCESEIDNNNNNECDFKELISNGYVTINSKKQLMWSF